jgi:hypothetical protein
VWAECWLFYFFYLILYLFFDDKVQRTGAKSVFPRSTSNAVLFIGHRLSSFFGQLLCPARTVDPCNCHWQFIVAPGAENLSRPNGEQRSVSLVR